jgi:hypothetical protein
MTLRSGSEPVILRLEDGPLSTTFGKGDDSDQRGSSRPLLPARRVAAVVETGNDNERFIRLDHKHKRVGRAAKQGAAHVFVDPWELAGTGAYALDRGINGLAKTSTEASCFVLVPVLRVD